MTTTIPTQLTIRTALASDLDDLVAFNQAMALETEGKHLTNEIISPGVQAVLLNPNLGFYLVANDGATIAGSLMITYEWSDWRNGMIWWIQSVYVLPQWRRKGVYTTLYSDVQQRAAQQKNVRGFRLYVEKNNLIAQQTYTRLMMQESDYLLFEHMLN